ncbi:MAG: 3-deoxy-manno-octulosonate cytidylyltransferase [Candidatus Edwardsbacteria bacterium]|nr:3-deoxy-manno-octulosonate cytidylyltransferase [Candidatus Edwardsbacteria bacterium]
MTRVLGVIPARFGSTRFPGKPLALLAGRPMIEHVYDRCRRAALLDETVVATDDGRIRRCVEGFGGTAVLTSRRHPSGTDRIAEVLSKPGFRHSNYDIVVNIQGDEPLVSPAAIDRLARAMIADPRLAMATLAARFGDRRELEDPNTVKIAADGGGYALYFSRAVIPFRRESARFDLRDYRKHIGMYAYRADFLKRFTAWPPGRLEGIERLEQLRALEHGVRIKVVGTRHYSPAVDTPADLRRVARILQGETGNYDNA